MLSILHTIFGRNTFSILGDMATTIHTQCTTFNAFIGHRKLIDNQHLPDGITRRMFFLISYSNS